MLQYLLIFLKKLGFSRKTLLLSAIDYSKGVNEDNDGGTNSVEQRITVSFSTAESLGYTFVCLNYVRNHILGLTHTHVHAHNCISKTGSY